MLVEARHLRRAAVAYTRNGGSPEALARGMRLTRAEARAFLHGRYHFLTPPCAERLLGLLNEDSRAYVRANARVHLVGSGKIPTTVLRPLVMEAIEEAGGVRALAFLTGLNERRIYAWTNLREQGVGFSVADKLVSRSLGPTRWRESDLRRWYFAGEVLH